MQIERLRIVNSTVMVYNIDGDSVALETHNLMSKIAHLKIELNVLDYYEDSGFQCCVTRLSLLVNGKTMVNESFIYSSVVPEISTVVAVSDTKSIHVQLKTTNSPLKVKTQRNYKYRCNSCWQWRTFDFSN